MDWLSFYSKIAFSQYPLSPIHFILWGFSLFLLLIFTVGIISLVKRKESPFAFAAESSLWGGSLLVIAQVISFYLGNPQNNIGWVILPIVFIVSLISAALAKDKKFISGFLTGLMTLSVVLIVSFPFLLLVGFMDISRYGLVGYLGSPLSLALSYLWIVLFYPPVLIFLAAFSFIGSFFNKNSNYTTNTKRSSAFLATLIILSIGAVTIDSVQSNNYVAQQTEAASSIVGESFQEKLISKNGKKVLELTYDLVVPEKGKYKAHASSLTPLNDPDFRGAIGPYEILLNNRLVKLYGNYFELAGGKNRIVFSYLPKKIKYVNAPDTFIGDGPYEINVRVSIEGKRGVPEKIILIKKYETQAYSGTEFINN